MTYGMVRTDWIGVEINPVHNGVYELKTIHLEYPNFSPHYSYWNGKFWSFTCGSIANATKYAGIESPSFQYNDSMYVAWRGLAEKPE